ncbi:hypothetical protein H5410_003646 [Solanum commersonii]|uniref:Uncharacterized protein n=1 Tax=Solanum commersonii TaxID=4109 RepID=A0A9J6B5H2_SOLCO|nr:hypothetical protein H5410_003646 [Solanum commersonii]
MLILHPFLSTRHSAYRWCLQCREEADRKRVAPMDTSPEVDIDMIPTEACIPTLVIRPSGTSSSTSSDAPGDVSRKPVKGCGPSKVYRFYFAYSGIAEIPHDSSTDISAYYEVPSATTKDEVRADVVAIESEAETDEEKLGVHEGMLSLTIRAHLGGAMLDLVVQPLEGCFMAGSKVEPRLPRPLCTSMPSIDGVYCIRKLHPSLA